MPASPAVRRAFPIALILAAFATFAQPASADIVGDARVIDGDTIDVAGERVRLHGIDAPETRQTCGVEGADWPCGRNASLVLANATAGQTVTCKGEKRDRYGRLVATCYVGDDDLNARMVRDGWALAYRKYAKTYVSEETEARASSAGMWQGAFVEPWEWRKQAKAAH